MNDNNESSRRAARKRWQLMLAQKRLACLMTVGAEYVEAVCNYLYLLSSEQRACEMVSLLEQASPDAYWKVFGTHWPNCDDTWALKDRLLIQLRNAAAAASMVPYYSDEQRTFFESLPEVVTIYRGCSRHRVAGLRGQRTF